MSPTDMSWQPDAAARPLLDPGTSPLPPIPLLVPRDLLHGVCMVPASTIERACSGTTGYQVNLGCDERRRGGVEWSRRPPVINGKLASLSYRSGVLASVA